MSIQGFTLADWSAFGYSNRHSDIAIRNLSDLGVTDCAILITTYQSSPSTSQLRLNDARTPGRNSVARALSEAHRQGMEVTLKLHVDIDDGTWRAEIDPENPGAWFAAYEAFVFAWAERAESWGVRQLIVGTELAGTLKHEQAWRNLIQGCRERFHGDLVYAASWDEAALVPFWDALDFVGINTYFPVATRRDPGRLEIMEAWQPWLSRMQLLHEQTDKQILVTEIGYRSIDGAGLHPYQFNTSGTLDLREQADLYWAALQVLAEPDWIEGVYWWNWLANGAGGPLNRDFTPFGKEAEQVLRDAWTSPTP